MRVGTQLLIAALALLVTVGAASQIYPVPSPEQAAQYAADEPKTILELQPFRQSHSMAIEGQDARQGSATLIELNPYINAGLLLIFDWGGAGGRASYHLQNPDPQGQRVRLAQDGLVITTAERDFPCRLWTDTPATLQQASASGLPYDPLCDGRLYLRNPVAGRRTDLERVADFLRDQVWGGEAIVGFVRDHVFHDAYREEGSAGAAARPAPTNETGPAPALLSEASAGLAVVPEHLGIDVMARTRGSWPSAAGTRRGPFRVSISVSSSRRLSLAPSSRAIRTARTGSIRSKPQRSTIWSPSISDRSTWASRSAATIPGSAGRRARAIPCAAARCSDRTGSARRRPW